MKNKILVVCIVLIGFLSLKLYNYQGRVCFDYVPLLSNRLEPVTLGDRTEVLEIKMLSLVEKLKNNNIIDDYKTTAKFVGSGGSEVRTEIVPLIKLKDLETKINLILDELNVAFIHNKEETIPESFSLQKRIYIDEVNAYNRYGQAK